jgi:hypothetical protein
MFHVSGGKLNSHVPVTTVKDESKPAVKEAQPSHCCCASWSLGGMSNDLLDRSDSLHVNHSKSILAKMS